MDLSIFNEYKEINLEIIKSIKENKEEISLFEKREEIIEKIFSLNSDRDEIRKIYKEKELDILDKELEDALREKMFSVKEEIKKIVIHKQANLGYVNASRKVNLFSKRI
ncbi:flagellar protein FliT [Clostridium weizhouense]|uniref:Flagellar protein FliT n=1 Tax=Clostridium weizhouense TaxID=2859781 RepID=A0ABS7AIT8_9CLOT|nr:flagellar protein FliT [Clostridium weizhouense]MBW6408580.1 flagellar protein FliT [Clostridium weizhouense]